MNEQKIRFYHLRWFSDYAYLNHYMTPLEKGGVTIAVKTLDDGTFEYGVAYCHINDAYCRKTGRDKALAILKEKPSTMKPASYLGYYWGIYCNRQLLAHILELMVFGHPTCPYMNYVINCPAEHHLGMVKFGYVCR